MSSPCGDMVRFAGEKGSCDLFPTLVQTCSIGVCLFRGKLVFVGTARAVRTKTQLAQHETKKWGYTAKGKKVGLGVFLAHGFRDGQYISEHRDIYVPIYLNSYISEYLCIRTHLNTYISEYRDVYVSVYLNSYISKYLYIHVSEHLHI
ncbi:hypothetical protein [Sphingobacterium sp. UDSM-2020]|uniref:hypothetical protein n=1 Tax=Sphingobacterium sp. UDSM-2020 TaxID=2795738 RepID=UPI001935D1F7|nr:hypothetical protein [Sphingobacterium sp. UDSM-2020]QQD14387.1 hypothetical protein JAZ75_02245 [Sphingobacterium sp. UDSM-2020]